jgi:hypothetical protein
MTVTRAEARQSDDLYVEDALRLEEPFGGVHARVEPIEGRIVCRAEWGGWSWRAEGPDRSTALTRLNRRLARLDPFEHSDEEWGAPGHQMGDLDGAIPPSTRARMQDHTQREARSAVGLLEAVFEAQARRPWAFPPERGPVPEGIEVEGYVSADGSLVLFPRTFYDIANAYFGRSAPSPAARRGGASSGPADGAGDEQPRFAGALRRLNEQGFMRSSEGGLPHQIRALEVYVFTPTPAG